MNTLTLQAAKATVARALKLCSTDSRVVDILNEAQWRLLNRPESPVGSLQRYRFCTDDNCITLPRQVRTVIKGAWCNEPARILPEWYEFDHNGPGQLHSTEFVGEAIIDQGRAATFDDVTVGQTNRKIRVTTDVAETGTYIWLKGFDENGQWIRTQIAGVWYDGERVDLSAAPVTTTNFFTAVSLVHKDATNGIVRIYEWNNDTSAVVKALGAYEPSETDPVYRRIRLPDIDNYPVCCEDDPDETSNKMVTLLVKLQHIPVSADLDTFVIGNLPALKLMAMSIQAEEEQRYQDSAGLEARARAELDGELAAYLGDGVRVGLSFESYELFGAGQVGNLVP